MAKGKKPLVVVTRKLPDTVETRMRELFDAQLNLDDKPMTQAQLTEAVKVADVLVPTVTDRIDAAVLGQSGDKLRLIANFGNGVDNIDVASALQRGITVTNTPGVLTEDTADMTSIAPTSRSTHSRIASLFIPEIQGNGRIDHTRYRRFVLRGPSDREGPLPRRTLASFRRGG